MVSILFTLPARTSASALLFPPYLCPLHILFSGPLSSLGSWEDLCKAMGVERKGSGSQRGRWGDLGQEVPAVASKCLSAGPSPTHARRPLSRGLSHLPRPPALSSVLRKNSKTLKKTRDLEVILSNLLQGRLGFPRGSCADRMGRLLTLDPVLFGGQCWKCEGIGLNL